MSNNYCEITPAIETLAQLSVENSTIQQEDYSRSGVMREKDTAPNTTAMTTPTSTVSGFFTLNRENKSISPLYGNITAKSTMFPV